MTDRRIYIPLSARPVEDRPREKLWQKGAESLSNAELLAILIRAGHTGRSAIQVADDLLASVPEGVSGLSKNHRRELLRTKGIGKANGASIAAALEIARRLNTAPCLGGSVYLETVEDVADYYRQHYMPSHVEKFVAFFITRRHRLLGETLIATGGSNAVVVDPQRVYKDALAHDAKAVILAHNHPGGGTTPSKHDSELTNRLSAAGELFAIPVVEHVIITSDSAEGMIGA